MPVKQFSAHLLAMAVDGQTITARLHRVDESKFQLLSRGFHWISERPFNR